MTEPLQAKLHELANDVTIVDLRDRVLHGSRRATIRRTVLSGLTALTALTLLATVVLWPRAESKPYLPVGVPSGAADLHVSMPYSPVFLPYDGHYAGNVILAVTVSGQIPTNSDIFMFIALPPGVSLPDDVLGACVAAPLPETWRCRRIPTPAASVVMSVRLNVAIAPAPHEMTVYGVRVRLAIGDEDATIYPDPTPSDNAVAAALVLSA